jgi:hypothetical protein
MKSELQKILEEKAKTIIKVSNYVDDFCTLQEREYIFELIKKIDIDFYNIIINKNMTFTFGDKYFYPANEFFICIPKDSNFKGLKKFCSNEVYNFLKQDYNKYKKNFNNYFDISNKLTN